MIVIEIRRHVGIDLPGDPPGAGATAAVTDTSPPLAIDPEQAPAVVERTFGITGAEPIPAQPPFTHAWRAKDPDGRLATIHARPAAG